MFTKKSILIILFILLFSSSSYSHVPSIELKALRTEITELRITITNLRIELARVKSRPTRDRKTRKMLTREKLELIRERRIERIQKANARATLRSIRISQKERLRDLRRTRAVTYPTNFSNRSTRRSTTVSVRKQQ